MRKIYNDMDGEYGKCGERATVAFFEGLGFRVTHLPDGKYGRDLFCESDYERFYCGSELRSPKTWPKHRDHFPYPTYNCLSRRERDAEESLLIVWRADMQKGIIVFTKDSFHFPVVYKTNCEAKDEDMRELPIERCLPICMSNVAICSIAAMNHNRIKNAMADSALSVQTKLRYLHPTNPYGVTKTEYARFLTDCGKNFVNSQSTVLPKKQFTQNMLFEI